MNDIKLKEDAIAQVTKMPAALKWISPIYQNDPDVVLAAMAQTVDVLAFASFKLRSNREFLKLAVELNPKAFNFVTSDKNIKNDRDFIIKALNSNDRDIIEKGCNWLIASDSLKEDSDLIRIAIKHNGLLLKTIGHIFKNDKDVVLSAIKNNPNSILYMDEKYYDDSELLLLAFERFSHINDASENISLDIYPKISSRLKNDKNFIKQLLNYNNMVFTFLSKDFKNDRELILEAVGSKVIFQYKNNNTSYKYIFSTLSPELQNDKEIVLKAVGANTEALQFASNELKDDPEVALTAANNNNNKEFDPFAKFPDTEIGLSPYTSDRIKNIVGQGDVETSLKSLILYEKLNNSIENKEEIKKPKLKI